jgi:hypothetical protein
MSPGEGFRRSIAMSRAARTSSARVDAAIAQPITRRLKTSTITARYRKPALVGRYVMSATYNVADITYRWRPEPAVKVKTA